MNLHQLRLFLTVVERGSFSQASRELHISQSALSVQVKRLETDLGLKLLQRAYTGVVPTAAGQEVYELSQGIFEQIGATERRIQILRSGDAGSLQLGTSHTSSLYFLTDVVKAFAQSAPQVSISITVDSVRRLYEAVQRGSLDVALQWGPGVPKGLTAVELLQEPFTVVASAQHPCAAQGTISREEFLAAPFVIFGYERGVLSAIEALLIERELLPQRITHLPSIDGVKRLVEANLGLTVLSLMSVERELAAKQLVPLSVPGLTLERPLLLVTHERVRSPALVRFSRFTQQFARARRSGFQSQAPL